MKNLAYLAFKKLSQYTPPNAQGGYSAQEKGYQSNTEMPSSTHLDVPAERDTRQEFDDQYRKETEEQNCTFFDGGDGTSGGAVKQINSQKSLPYGYWVKPNGDLIEVDFEEHEYVAEAILKNFNVEYARGEATDALCNKGYLRVIATELGLEAGDIPNTAQLESLKKIAEDKHIYVIGYSELGKKVTLYSPFNKPEESNMSENLFNKLSQATKRLIIKKLAQQGDCDPYISDSGTNYHRDDQFKSKDPEGYGQVEYTGLEDGALESLPTAENQDKTRGSDFIGPIKSREVGPDGYIEEDIIPSTPNISNVYLAHRKLRDNFAV